MNHKINRTTRLLLSAFAGLMVLVSCRSNPLSEHEEPQKDPPKSDPVPADGRLEAVTWNIEWFGSDSRGPSDEELQASNVVQVMDSLQADLYALQEIESREALDRILNRLSGYSGFTADYAAGFQPNTAFIYNTNAIDSLSSAILTEGQDGYDWASGRYPLMFSFNYHYQESTVEILAVVIHAKANIGNSTEKEEAYHRRRRAADSLYTYLQQQNPDDRIILLGDFNDDVDVSIYDGSSPSPYEDFEPSSSFEAITGSISAAGESSYIAGNYTDLIDHIVISNELFSLYNDSSEQIYHRAETFIENYVETTSDHLPVWATFDIAPAKSAALSGQ